MVLRIVSSLSMSPDVWCNSGTLARKSQAAGAALAPH